MTSSEPSSSSRKDPRLFGEELETRLDEVLFASHSHRSATRIAQGLESLNRAQQEKLLHWAAVAAQTYAEIGYQIATLAPRAFTLFDDEAFDAWVLAGLDAFDRHGARAAMDLLRDLEGFHADRGGERPLAEFTEIEARLSRFIQGLSGRPLGLSVGAGAAAWTDTETLYLPLKIGALPQAESNRSLYKVLATMLWAQTRFGTFGSASIDLAAALTPWLETTDQERALNWLAVLESVRLEARIAAELPGLAAEIATLRGPWPTQMEPLLVRLHQHQASLADTLALLPGCMESNEDAPHLPHFVAIDPDAALRVRGERIAHDKETLNRAISALKGSAAAPNLDDPGIAPLAAESAEVAMSFAEDALALPPEARAAAQSLLQDLGEVPPECLVPAGTGHWQETQREGGGEDYTSHREPDHRYDEWDYRRKAYRRGWCHLYECEGRHGLATYVDEVRVRHSGLIRQIRRRFEMLRGENRMLGRQPEGEEIDIDALVDAMSDRSSGAEPSDRLFCRRIRNERSLAAMFMVDMSGSTKGWVNDAEREALVMLCEAIESLGDAYAIYGFSGWTRTRSDIYRIKRFDERYDEAVRARIAGVEAKDYTRMGVAIRHLTQLLLRQPARHRLLITLSDGRPDDFGDEYRGQYGIEDTRRALLEAREQGVRSYCVTIDRHGADYLAHMYGVARYTVLDDVKKLPLKIADIYRRLAS
ncbi:MAG: VWA domain-containing protein [Betaproteobacteria bacterium]|nr:VWA domain-containing protein [Betaproteobacteria bacterium]